MEKEITTGKKVNKQTTNTIKVNSKDNNQSNTDKLGKIFSDIIVA